MVINFKKCFLGDFVSMKVVAIAEKIEFAALAIEEPKEMLTFNMCRSMIFFPIVLECTKVDGIFVSIAQNSRNLSCLELSPALHMFHYAVKSGMFVLRKLHQHRAGSGTDTPSARPTVRI